MKHQPAVSRDKPIDQGCIESRERDQIVLAYQDRIRAIEFSRLQLERKLEAMERHRLEQISESRLQSEEHARAMADLQLAMTQAERAHVQQLNQLRNEIDRSRMEASEAEDLLTQQLAASQAMLSDQYALRDKLQNQLQKAECVASGLRSEVDTASREHERLATQLRSERDALSSQVKELESNLAVIHAKSNTLEQQLHEVNGVRDKLQDQLQKAECVASGLRSEVDTASREHERLASQLRSERDALSAQVSELESSLAVIRAKADTFERQSRDVAAQLDIAHQDHRQALDSVERDRASLLQQHAVQLHGARVQLSNREKEVADARLALREEVACRDKMMAELASTRQRLESSIEAAAESADKAAAKVHNLNGELAQLRAESGRQQRNLGRRESELLASRRRVEELNSMLVQANAKIESLLLASDEQGARSESLEASLLHTNTDLEETQKQLAKAQRESQEIRGSTSFALGQAVAQAARSWRGALALPGALSVLWVRSRNRHRNQLGAGFIESGALMERVIQALPRASAEELERLADEIPGTAAERAHVLTTVAKSTFATDPGQALRMGELAHSLEPAPFRTKWLAFLHFDAGHVSSAASWLSRLPDSHGLQASELAKAKKISGLAELMKTKPTLPEGTSHQPTEAALHRVVYVAASVLPYHQTGYTLRTQAVCSALSAAGIDVVCITRPGYPSDRTDAMPATDAERWQIDGVEYLALGGHGRDEVGPVEYLAQSADVYCDAFARLKPALVHAASNHESALPALVAARRLGLPFVYEVRGLWELSAASRVPGWEDRERFAIERDLETLVACEADMVFALSQGLVDELTRRGVDPERIRLAPNGIDVEALNGSTVQEAHDPALAKKLGLANAPFVVGYVGSLVSYEGLDDLLRAVQSLTDRHPGLRTLIIGGGDQLESLQAMAHALGIADKVVFTGRIPRANVASHLALCDCLVVPRKPELVCEMVTPLKPLEAMAAGIPIIASNLAALREIIIDGQTGLLHEPASPHALALAIERLLADPAMASAIGNRARDYVATQRTWPRLAVGMVDTYAALDPSFQVLASAKGEVASALDDIGGLLLMLPAGTKSLTQDQKQKWEESTSKALQSGGTNALINLVSRQSEGLSGRVQGFLAVKAAFCALREGDTETAKRLVQAAVQASNDRTTLKGAATVLFNCCEDDQALALLNAAQAAPAGLDDSSRALMNQIHSRKKLFLEASTRVDGSSFPGEANTSINFLHFSLPYTSVGYATRSHGIALGVQAAGWKIKPYTRPGFPQDFKPELEGKDIPDVDEIDGIHYHRLSGGGRRGISESDYLLQAADRCEEAIRKEQPVLVHAASNYTTALPALVAARRLGLPFVYEIRGFWEITRSSRDAAFEKSIKFRNMQHFEDLVVREADHIVTITTAMKEELVQRGVAPERISIAFNSVDPERFLPLERDGALASRLGIAPGVPVIGYVGSFVDYEGLDDLVAAAAIIRDAGIDFRLLLVGDGAVIDQLRELIRASGLDDIAILTGRVPHEEVEAYYSLIDIAPFPRKPWQVCELVSPLKPFEAMAMQKPVVVSNTRALVEIVTDGLNGFLFEKGDPESLASVLIRLLADPELRRATGVQARAWVEEFRSWKRAGSDIVSAYERIVPESSMITEGVAP